MIISRGKHKQLTTNFTDRRRRFSLVTWNTKKMALMSLIMGVVVFGLVAPAEDNDTNSKSSTQVILA